MSMRIITGYTAQPHITSDDDAALHRGLIGSGDFVLNVGNMFAATIVTNNLVKILDGEIVIQGKQGRINTNDYEELVINNGTQGMKRNDIIVARYSKNSSTGIESIALAVVQGTPAATAIDPTLTQGDIPSGALIREVPLYRVAINGINIESVTKMFSVASSLAEKANKSSQVFTPSLVNGWTNFEQGYETIKYWKDDLGIVHIQGAITAGTANVMFILPAGYRPSGFLLVTVASVNSSSGWDDFQVMIRPNGSVEVNTGIVGKTHVFSASFLAA